MPFSDSEEAAVDASPSPSVIATELQAVSGSKQQAAAAAALLQPQMTAAMAAGSVAPSRQQQEQAEADSASPKSSGSDNVEVPGADAPLQCYRGSLQPGGQCRYTHFNGSRCNKGGRKADDLSKPQGGFCTRKDKPKDADVMSGAAVGRFCPSADGPRSMFEKVAGVVSVTCGRLLGK